MIKLLIVDDEKGLCDYLKKFFKARGYDVFTAIDGESALSIVKKENPELVLLDINMPGISGLEVLRRIKNASLKPKVIMVTVSDDADTREKARHFGADEFVKKPFTTDYLEDVVILKVNEITRLKESPQILIVDDEEDARSSIKNFLERNFECRITEAANGEAALGLLKKDNFDLVFLDIKMPGMSGMDILREKTKLPHKPCFWVMTAFDSQEVAGKVIELGADDYLTKPLSLKVLDSKVRNFLAGIGKYKPR